METSPKITVLGIHRIPITDGLVKDVIISFGPPSAEVEAHVRSFLSRVVLVELLVENPNSTFDEVDIKQPSTSGMLRSFFDGVFLAPDGSDVLAAAGDELPEGHDTFRVAIWLRDWKDDEPLLTSYGPRDLPEFTPMPERLQRLVPYVGD